jgi:hypothetical protein
MNRTNYLAGCIFVLLIAVQVHAQSTTLSVDVFSPTPPITPADVVSLRAITPIDVFPDTGHLISSSFTVNGFDIDWDITSMDRDGVVLFVLLPMGTINDVGPLAAGTYHVTANWNHIGPGLLVGAPSSGTGFLTFTVVPEPGTGLLAAIGAIAAANSARRRSRS